MKKRILSTLMALAMAMSLLPATAFAAESEAVPWAADAVNALNEIYDSDPFSATTDLMVKSDVEAILKAIGCEDEVDLNKFEITDTGLTRSQACDILTDAYDVPVTGGSAIQYLYEQNLVNGTADGDLNEDGAINDAQFAVIAYRVLNSVGGGKGAGVDGLKPGTDEHFSWTYLRAQLVLGDKDEPTKTMDSETLNGWIKAIDNEKLSADSITLENDTTMAQVAAIIVKDILQINQIFADVAPGAWYYDGVMYLFDHGIVNGVGPGQFGPDDPLTHNQLATLLFRADGQKPNSTGWNEQLANDIQPYVVKMEYLTPDNSAENWWVDSATREEVLLAILKQQKYTDTSANLTILDRFSDSDQISENAKPYIAHAVSLGLVSGTANGELMPAAESTRAMGGVFLYRAMLGADTTKMQDYNENVQNALGTAEASAATFALRAAPTTTKTLTLREDWRLTSDLDLAVPDGTVLEIYGNGHYIYEMGGTLQNSGSGIVKFVNGTVVYEQGGSTPSDFAKISQAAANDVTVSDPAKGATTLTLPANVAIASSSNEAVISTTGNITTPQLDTTVDLGLIFSNEGGTVIAEGPTVSVTVQGTYSTVTVSGSYSTATGEGNYLPGASVTIEAGSRSGYRFTGWTGLDGLTITAGDSSSASVTFTMPDEDVSVTANWKKKSSGSSSTTTPSTPPAQEEPDTSTVTNPDGSTTTTTTDKDTGTVTEVTENTDGSTTTVVTETDGTVTTTATDPDGNTVETVANPDGSSSTTIDNADGTYSVTTVDENGVVQAETSIPAALVEEAVENGQAVTLPIYQLPVSADQDTAPTVVVGTPQGEEILVEIPLEETDLSTVVLLVNPDGSEEVLMDSEPSANGVTASIPGGATVKVVDNAMAFNDTGAGQWYDDAVAFNSARGVMNGTGDGNFSPADPANRAMMWTMLARLAGTETEGGDPWYEKGMAWAVDNAVSDGTQALDNITREQLAVMMWRYLGQPASAGSYAHFNDAGQVSTWAEEAIAWAVEIGLLQGSDGNLNPSDNATRAEVAQMFMNFMTKTDWK